MTTAPVTVRADEVRKGDYLTNGFGVDDRSKWSRVAAVRVLKSGRIAIRLAATGGWGSTLHGTHQDISYVAADSMIEVAR